MSTSDKVRALVSLSGKKTVDLAGYLGMSRQSMSNKLNRDSWSAEDLIKVAQFVGADLVFEMPDRQRITLYANE